MKYPSWKDFESKYPDYQEIAFEALARMLFRCRYELGDSLPYFKNHAGNETETIVVDGEEIGFQAKYFDNEINASLIEHSIKTAHNNHPSQSKMIVYTNLEFGNPRKRGETKTEKQKNKHPGRKKNLALMLLAILAAMLCVIMPGKMMDRQAKAQADAQLANVDRNTQVVDYGCWNGQFLRLVDLMSMVEGLMALCEGQRWWNRCIKTG